MALVGAINELILQYIEQDRVAQLQELVGPASQLVRAVTADDFTLGPADDGCLDLVAVIAVPPGDATAS